MKTTIDIPEAIYKKAKIRAIERGQTLKDIVLTSLIKELEPPSSIPATGQSFIERRKLLPEYARFEEDGAFTPSPADRDITKLIADDRDGL